MKLILTKEELGIRQDYLEEAYLRLGLLIDIFEEAFPDQKQLAHFIDLIKIISELSPNERFKKDWQENNEKTRRNMLAGE